MDVDSFALVPGRRLARKYVVGELLGRGWEGEVYHVTEISTGIERAAKFFFPQRNPRNRAITFYAKKLNKLHLFNPDSVSHPRLVSLPWPRDSLSG